MARQEPQTHWPVTRAQAGYCGLMKCWREDSQQTLVLVETCALLAFCEPWNHAIFDESSVRSGERDCLRKRNRSPIEAVIIKAMGCSNALNLKPELQIRMNTYKAPSRRIFCSRESLKGRPQLIPDEQGSCMSTLDVIAWCCPGASSWSLS